MDHKAVWYFSVDPAFKTYAYALVRMWEIDDNVIEKIRDITADIHGVLSDKQHCGNNTIDDGPARRGNTIDDGPARRGEKLKTIIKKIENLTQILKDYFVVMSGATVDLAPDIKVRKLSALDRVIRVSDYLEFVIGDVFKKLKDTGCPQPDSKDLNVIVEHQMGPNTVSGTPADLTINFFKRANITEIGAGFKNKVRIEGRPDLDHSKYFAKYKTNKSANKNHTKHLYFDLIQPLFDHKNFVVPKNKRDDFADCIIQIIGCRQFADYDLLKTKF
jgi:hypothetical protein